MEAYFWFAIAGTLMIIEIATLGLTTIWFAAGALVAFLAAYIGFGVPVQVIIFLAVSIILLILTRPIAIKYFNQERQKTNAESLIGQKAIVIEEVNPLQATGKVEVNGMEWSAKTEESDRIEVSTVVSIKGIQGVKLIVEKEEV